MIPKDKKQTVKLNICLTPNVLEKLDEGNYNKSKLIISLLEKFLLKKQK